eukprot:TRINITY_DN4406_c0_g1_i3.p1 TRINITY_DN4406_c0_g1~~TRINITY_DN4406_c0_g1_i3.p1  ORF type:complete len:107 (+),score=24.24 TRINITY_DN4406_c0_g1_i3:94-414(+)
MKANGALLSVAGDDASVEKIIGGVLSSVWLSFDDEGVACFGPANRQRILLADCANGKLCVSLVGKFLLALYAEDAKIPVGLLLSKTKSLSLALHQPLSRVYNSTNQ